MSDFLTGPILPTIIASVGFTFIASVLLMEREIRKASDEHFQRGYTAGRMDEFFDRLQKTIAENERKWHEVSE